MGENEKDNGGKRNPLEEALNQTEDIFCSNCQKKRTWVYIGVKDGEHEYQCGGCGRKVPYSQIKAEELESCGISGLSK